MYHPRLRGNHYDMGRHYEAVALGMNKAKRK